MVALVKAEIEVLARLGLIREGGQIAEARRDGEIGGEGLVVGRIDILYAASEGEPVDVGVRLVEEALELGAGIDRNPEGQVADRGRPGEVAYRKCAPARLTPGAQFQRVRIVVEGREKVEPKLRTCGLLFGSWRS
jgi:hypothetical protein